jgi:hypothetical protein
VVQIAVRRALRPRRIASIAAGSWAIFAGLVRVSARRVKFALASACPYADEWRLAAARLVTTA